MANDPLTFTLDGSITVCRYYLNGRESFALYVGPVKIKIDKRTFTSLYELLDRHYFTQTDNPLDYPHKLP